MWILPVIGYVGGVVGFCFLTLAIASGLYYLSELVEEHSVIAKRFLTRLIYGVVGIQALLLVVDGFPFWATLLGILSHIVYLGNMRRFPFVRLTDPLFILSCRMYMQSPPRCTLLTSSPGSDQPLRLVPTLFQPADKCIPTIILL